MNRRDALRKAAAGAAVAGAAWSAPAVKGLSVVPDYAAAGTSTGLTRVFRILGVDRDYNELDVSTVTHDFRGLPTPDVSATGGWGVAPPGDPAYSPSTAQVLENGPAGHPGSLVTMTATLGAAGSVSATMQNSPSVYFRADASSNPTYTAPERIQIPVTFNVDPPFNKCSVTEGTLFRSVSYIAFNDVWDLAPGSDAMNYPYPAPLEAPSPTTLGPAPAPLAPEYFTQPASLSNTPGLTSNVAPWMNISPAPLPNNPGTFTQIITVENRQQPGAPNQNQRILEIRFVVSCTT